MVFIVRIKSNIVNTKRLNLLKTKEATARF